MHSTAPLLGIDIGISVIKATLFASDGREITAQRLSPASYPNSGWVEKEVTKIWLTVAEVIREVLASRPSGSEPIGGISVCACGNGLIILDHEGRPLRPAIFSNDRRAAEISASWLTPARFARTQQRPYPGQTASLLAWLRHYEPQTYARIGHVLLLKDYVRYCLTGRIASDHSDLSATNLIPLGDDTAEGLSAHLDDLELPGIACALPTPLPSAAFAGEITSEASAATGVPTGTPVAAGALDCEAALLGSGISSSPILSLVAGSWAINQALVSTLPGSPVAQTIRSAFPNRFTVIEGSPTSALNFDWFVNHLFASENARHRAAGHDPFAHFASQAAQVAPRMTLPLYLPYLHGSPLAAGATGAFYGLTPENGSAELARAVLEGVCFSHRWHLERLQAANLRFSSARLTGGASRSPFWVQLFADTLGLPIEVPHGNEIGARGAALCAGVAIGQWTDIASAQSETYRPALCAEPDSTRVALQSERYARFCRLVTALEPVWKADGV
jgi:L-xylulokinase